MKRLLALCMACLLCLIPMAETFVLADGGVPAGQTEPVDATGGAPATTEPVTTDAPVDPPAGDSGEQPTEAPSNEPSEAPSEEPSEAPTEEPTEAPAEELLEAPTDMAIPALEGDLLPAGFENALRPLEFGDTSISLGAGYQFYRLNAVESAAVEIAVLGDVDVRQYLFAFEAQDAAAIAKSEPGDTLTSALEADKQYILALAKAGENQVDATLRVTASAPAMMMSPMALLPYDTGTVNIVTMRLQKNNAVGGVIYTEEEGFNKYIDEAAFLTEWVVGEVLGDYRIAYPPKFPLVAVANDGYRFLNWAVTKNSAPVTLLDSKKAMLSTLRNALGDADPQSFQVTAHFGKMQEPTLTKGEVSIHSLPGKPTVMVHSVELAWTRLDEIHGYELTVSPGTGKDEVDVYTFYTDEDDYEDGFKIDNMDPSVKYTFTLRGIYDDAKDGDAETVGGVYYTLPATVTHELGWRTNKMKLTATSENYTAIQLDWTAMPYAEGYRVERKDPYKDYKVLTGGVLGADGLSYTDNTPLVGVTYSYRVVALNEKLSPTTGANIDKNPPSATVSAKTMDFPKLALSLKVVDCNTILLAWNGVQDVTDGYDIYRKEGTGFYTKIGTGFSDTTFEYQDEDLVPGTTYSYYVEAAVLVNKALAGTENRKITSSPVSGKPDWKRPTLKIAPISDDSIRLAWTDSPGADYYNVYRVQKSSLASKIDVASDADLIDTVEVGGLEEIVTVNPKTGVSVVTYVWEDTGLSSAIKYYYRVVPGLDGMVPEKRVLSNTASAKPAWPKLSPKVLRTSPAEILLTWSGVDGQAYDIYRSTTSAFPKGTSPHEPSWAWNPSGWRDDTDIVQNKKYYYWVVPVAAGLSTKGTPLSAHAKSVSAIAKYEAIKVTINVDPTTRKTISPLPGGGLSNVLHWNKIFGVEKYLVVWATSSKYLSIDNPNAVLVETPLNETTYTYTHRYRETGELLDYTKTYYYKVYPILDGCISDSKSASAAKSRKPVWYYKVALSAAPFGYRGTTLAWTSKLNALDTEHYSQFQVVAGSRLVYEGSELTCNDLALQTATYSYRVRPVIEENGETNYGPWSSIKTVKPAWSKIVIEVVNSFADSVTIRWNRQPYATHYRIERATSSNGPWETVEVEDASEGDPEEFGSNPYQTYTDHVDPEDEYVEDVSFSPLRADTTYYYRVRAFIMGGEAGGLSAVKSVKTVLSAPILEKITKDCDYQGCTINWAPVPGANGYIVYRSTSRTGTYVSVSTLKAADAENVDGSCGFTDSGLNTGTQYFYKVRAYYDVVPGVSVPGNLSTEQGYLPTLGLIPAGDLTFTRMEGDYETYTKLNWPTVPGATGYEISYTTGTSTRFSVVGTLRASAVAPVFYHYRIMLPKTTALKYRVRPYRVVNGKNVYGGLTQALSAD